MASHFEVSRSLDSLGVTWKCIRSWGSDAAYAELVVECWKKVVLISDWGFHGGRWWATSLCWLYPCLAAFKSTCKPNNGKPINSRAMRAGVRTAASRYAQGTSVRAVDIGSPCLYNAPYAWDFRSAQVLAEPHGLVPGALFSPIRTHVML